MISRISIAPVMLISPMMPNTVFAIIAAAGLINACEVTGRRLEDCKMVVNGAGASALACTALVKAMGIKHENVIVCDRTGPIYPGRADVDQWKSAHAVETEARSLEEALDGADIFLGLSAAGALKPEWVAQSNAARAPILQQLVGKRKMDLQSARASTAALAAVSLKAGGIVASRRAPFAMVEEICLTVIMAGVHSGDTLAAEAD